MPPSLLQDLPGPVVAGPPLVEAVVLTYFAWRRTSSLQYPYVNCYLCIRIEVVVVVLVAPLALCLPTFP